MDIILATHSRFKKSKCGIMTVLDRTYSRMIEHSLSKYILKGVPKVSVLTAKVKVWSIFIRKIYLGRKEGQFVKLSRMFYNFMSGKMYACLLTCSENMNFYCHP